MGALLKCYTGRSGVSLRLSPEAFGGQSKKKRMALIAAQSPPKVPAAIRNGTGTLLSAMLVATGPRKRRSKRKKR